MTENEAIEELKCYTSQSGTSHPEEIEIAIKALEEVQQYRRIGTPEECRAAMEKQPVFNIDKVVEQLEEACISPSDYPGFVVDIEKAIEIVKGGGVDA